MSLLLCLLTSSALAAWPASGDWVSLNQGGVPITDGAQDMNSTDESVDLVGTATNPTGYWASDGTVMYFRLRLNETAEQGGGILDLQDHGWGVAFNTDSDLTNFEYVVAVDQLTGVLTLRQNVDGTAGPAATSTIITTVSRRGVDDGLVRVVAAGSTIDGDADYFLDFQATIASMKANFGMTDATLFRMAMLTADDGAETMNADMAGASTLSDMTKGWTDVASIDRDFDGLTDPEEAVLKTDPADADSDDDGLLDGREAASTLDPLACDTDGDDLPDGLEWGVVTADLSKDTDLGAECFLPDTNPATTTNPDDEDSDGGGVLDGDEDWNRDGAVGEWEIDPNLILDDLDTDKDGIWDVLELKCPLDSGNINDVDSDGDGISDATEWLIDTDGDGLPDFCDTDSDGDGIDDSVEGEVDTDKDGTPDYRDTDSDGDGKTDKDEGVGDNDGDGIPNYRDPDDEDGPDGDRDDDGLTNSDEDDCGSDPDKKDSDNDGIPDADEYPCDSDSDCDGVIDVLDPTDDDECDTDDTGDTGDTAVPQGSGNYTGGSCSAASTGPALPLTLFGALGLAGLIRRRRGRGRTNTRAVKPRHAAVALPALGLAGLALLLPAPAQAQDSDTKLNAQRFRPARDGARMFSVDDTVVGEAWTPGGSLIFNYADDPLAYRYDDESTPDARLLGHVGTADLVGFINLPSVRLGVNLPLHLTSGGYGVDGFRLIGDARLSAGGELLARGSDGGLGLGVEGRLDLPTGNGSARLGQGRTTLGAGIMASYEAGPVLLATNLGLGTGTGQAFPSDVKLGPNFEYGLGAALDVTSTVGVSAEITGESYVSKQGGVPGASPAEVLAGLRWRPVEDLVLSLGAGTGLSKGVAAPDYRVVIGLGFSPRTKGVKLAVLANDRDGDGIPDDVDLCPGQAEDFNGIDDGDGCPDGNLTPTRIKVMDDRGDLIAESTVRLVSGPSTGGFTLPDGELVRSLEPGKYSVEVMANGYMSRTVKLGVPKEKSHEQVVRLEKLVGKGGLVVTARNEAGLPVAASVRVLGDNGVRVPGEADGVVELTLPPGSYNVIVSANGYGNVEKAVTIEEKGTSSIEVVMPEGKVKIEGDRVLILEKVYFELNSAQIKASSFGLLDEVAATLINNPELQLLEVQGHTDQQGSATYNQGLSERRAASVKTYLVTQGVEAARLVSKGYGEAQPLINETNDEAYAANRRVEFHILRRSK